MKYLYALLTTFIISAAINPTFAANKATVAVELSGSWQGALSVSGQQIPLVFHIKKTDNGTLAATMDSPAQGATNIPVESVSVAEAQVSINIKVAQALFIGQLDIQNSQIDGVWQQGPNKLPLVLKKVAVKPAAAKVNRPQHPIAPFPYKAQEVSFTNRKAKIELTGTLTLPTLEEQYPAVILITGSGPQDRDQTFMGHKTFWVLADFLTRQGIAVLRFDDRGVGKSQGNFASANSADFAEDAASAFDYLRGHPNIINSKIGLIGHSEGGLIAPITATLRSNLGFIALLAAPGQTGAQISIWQIQSFLQANGLSSQAAIAGSKITQALNQVVINNSHRDTLSSELVEAHDTVWQSLTDSIKSEIKSIGGGKLSEARIQQLSSNWTRYFLTHDPANYLRQLTIPVLALHGDKDTQMSAELNLSDIDKALEGNNNPSNRIEMVSGVNHLFQTANSGLMSEYAQIEETVSPYVLDVLSDWILSVTLTNH